MKTVNSLSSGQSSSYMAVHYPADYNIFAVVVLDDPSCKIKDPSLLQYARQKLQRDIIGTAEDDMSLQVMRDLEQVIGREITWVSGVSFDSLIDDGRQNYLPSWARRYCTVEMKLQPIFNWWFQNIGERIKMRIGFRFDEFSRMEGFVNREPNKWKEPVSAHINTKRQKHKDFIWRYCQFPLIKDGVTKEEVKKYWRLNSRIPASLFAEEKYLQFPVISNCVGCFHKQKETLAVMSREQPEKFNWFAKQEKKGKGFWHDDKVPYEWISRNASDLWKERHFEMTVLGQSCDSGGGVLIDNLNKIQNYNRKNMKQDIEKRMAPIIDGITDLNNAGGNIDDYKALLREIGDDTDLLREVIVTLGVAQYHEGKKAILSGYKYDRNQAGYKSKILKVYLRLARNYLFAAAVGREEEC